MENASEAMLSSFLVGTSQERYLQAVSEIAKRLVELCYPAAPSSSSSYENKPEINITQSIASFSKKYHLPNVPKVFPSSNSHGPSSWM